MIIDNQKTIIRNKLRKLYFALLAVALIVILFTAEDIKDNISEINKILLAILIALIYFAYLFYQIKLEPNYIFFSDESDKIILRFYATGVSSSRKNSIEIPKTQLYKYEVVKTLFNQKEKLILYQKTNKGIFKYPTVCLSALSNKEKNILKNSLKKHLIRS